MKKCKYIGCIIVAISVFVPALYSQPIIIDHHCVGITQLPLTAIQAAKSNLHIGYGHTSHGSQITDGMNGLVAFANDGGKGLNHPPNTFAWNNGGTAGALDLEEGDGYGSGWLDHDAGYYPAWINETREYLNDASHADVNVIMWAWCGQLSWYSELDVINQYLDPMNQLENDYPHVTFVYMTGHADGSGEPGNLHQRNRQIRQYCQNNNKVLFDFYDIECYDPDGNYYGDKYVTDECWYDSNGDGSQDTNWAQDWQNNHAQGVDWYQCGSAHSEPLNANQKAFAAWWLFARLAGWDGTTAVDDGEEVSPRQFDLLPNFPNPFNPGTQIGFDIQEGGPVQLSVFDIRGREMVTLIEGNMNAGRHQVRWDGRDKFGNDTPSGLYTCQLIMNGQRITRKMLKME